MTRSRSGFLGHFTDAGDTPDADTFTTAPIATLFSGLATAAAEQCSLSATTPAAPPMQ